MRLGCGGVGDNRIGIQKYNTHEKKLITKTKLYPILFNGNGDGDALLPARKTTSNTTEEEEISKGTRKIIWIMFLKTKQKESKNMKEKSEKKEEKKKLNKETQLSVCVCML